MTKWKIWYNIGYGREEEEIEASNEDEASEAAYEAFSQACEGQFDWGQEELEEEPAEASHEVSEALDEAISEELAEGTPNIMKEGD